MFLGFLPIFNGEYPDFNSHWYENVGKTICLTMMINIFSPHASKLMMPLIQLIFRFLDRGCKMGLLGDKSDDKTLKTKKVMQDDLNALYTGA